MSNQTTTEEYKYGFHDNNKNIETFDKGLSYGVVNRISEIKSEPEWMRERRLEALKIFNQKKMPEWGGDMNGIDFNNIIIMLNHQISKSKIGMMFLMKFVIPMISWVYQKQKRNI